MPHTKDFQQISQVKMVSYDWRRNTNAVPVLRKVADKEEWVGSFIFLCSQGSLAWVVHEMKAEQSCETYVNTNK